MNNSVNGISSHTRADAFLVPSDNNPLLNLQKAEEANIILDPVSNNGDLEPANETPASSILAVWQKSLNNQRRLYKYYEGPGAIHGDVTQSTDSSPSTNHANPKTPSHLDKVLSSQIAEQAQEILSNKEKAHFGETP